MSTFEASCATDEVLIIRTARLGRLRLGRTFIHGDDNYLISNVYTDIQCNLIHAALR